MATLQEILARAQALREETALGSISPERAGSIMYDTLQQINQMQLEGAGLVINKIYASVAAMEEDDAPVSDLTGNALKPGQLVVIVPSDTSSSDMGSVYRYDGTTEGTSSWSFAGKVGGYPMDTTPTEGSTRAVTSGGVYKKIQAVINMLAPLAFRESPNPADPLFRGIFIYPTSTAGIAVIRYGTASTQEIYMLSPVIDLGEIGETYSIQFGAGKIISGNNLYPCLLLLDEDYEFSSYWTQNALPRTVSGTVSSSMRYARLVFPAEHLLDAFVLDVNSGSFLFNGADIQTSDVRGAEDFVGNAFIPAAWQPNSRGDFIGWNFANSNSAVTAQRTVVDYPYYKRIGPAATAIPYSISKVVELPKNTTINLEFSCGVVDTNLMLRVLNPSAGTANFYAANANPRTVSINTATWTHVQLYFLTANYADCYIKDATNDVILWQGAASTD